MFYVHFRWLYFVDKKYTEDNVKDNVEGNVVADNDDLNIKTWAAYYRVLKGHVFWYIPGNTTNKLEHGYIKVQVRRRGMFFFQCMPDFKVVVTSCFHFFVCFVCVCVIPYVCIGHNRFHGCPIKCLSLSMLMYPDKLKIWLGFVHGLLILLTLS